MSNPIIPGSSQNLRAQAIQGSQNVPVTISVEPGQGLPSSKTVNEQIQKTKGAKALEIIKLIVKIALAVLGTLGLILAFLPEKIAFLLVSGLLAPFTESNKLAKLMDQSYMEAYGKIWDMALTKEPPKKAPSDVRIEGTDLPRHSQASIVIQNSDGRKEPVRQGLTADEKLALRNREQERIVKERQELLSRPTNPGQDPNNNNTSGTQIRIDLET